MPIKPDLLLHIDAARAVLARRPSALLTDVDGTISPIQPSPDLSYVPDRARRALERVADQVDLVGAVSGRSLDSVRALVNLPSLTYVGNHGLEMWRDEKVILDPEVEAYIEPIQAATRAAALRLRREGVLVEPKGITTSIHYRLAENHDEAREWILQQLAAIPEVRRVRVTQGRMVVNLVPPLEHNKGTAVRALARQHGLRGIVYLGDDTTDVDAFEALRALREQGIETMAVAVVSAESPPALLEYADYQVEGVEGVVKALEQLGRGESRADTPSPE